jgi:alpha-1,2-mannosyltransferase
VRNFWSSVWKLVAVFGAYGLVIWPATILLGSHLIAREVASIEGLNVDNATLIGRDFVNIWHGGREAAVNGAEGVYDRKVYRQTIAESAGVQGIYTYSYPPHMLMLSIPFGQFDYPWALAVWTLGGLGLFWWAARPWLRDVGLPSWSVLLLPGGVINLWAGHFGFLVAALVLLGYRCARDKPMASGAAFALLTVKPHLGLLVPVVLFVRAQWQLCLQIVGWLCLLLAASLLIFGWSAWESWISSTLSYQLTLTNIPSGYQFITMMPTVRRAVMGGTSDPTIILLFPVLVAVIIIALLLLILKRGASVRDAGLASQVATFLVLPYIFHYDMVIISLIALISARRWPSRWFMPDRFVYGAAFIAPLTQVPLAHLGLWVSPLAIGGLFALMCWNILTKELAPSHD